MSLHPDDWRDDLRLRLRTAVIGEFLEYGRSADSLPPDFLSDLLLAVEECFAPENG